MNKGNEPENDNHMRQDCPVIENQCDFFSYQCDRDNEIVLVHCTHPDNLDEDEGNCTHTLCPKTGPAGEDVS